MPTMTKVDSARPLFLSEEKAAGGRPIPDLIGGVLDAVVKFERVDDYTTFLAEYAFVGGDIVLHFFPPREAYVQQGDRARVVNDYLLWFQRRFPEILSPLAEQYFQATRPVLVAQYVPEMTSWWMRCGGFALRLDPDQYIKRFLEQLDQQLDVASKPPVPRSSF